MFQGNAAVSMTRKPFMGPPVPDHNKAFDFNAVPALRIVGTPTVVATAAAEALAPERTAERSRGDEGVGIDPGKPPRPKGVSDQQLLDAWHLLHCPKASVAGRKDKKTGVISRSHPGLIHRPKITMIKGASVSDITVAANPVHHEDHQRRVARSMENRTAVGHTQPQELINPKAMQYHQEMHEFRVDMWMQYLKDGKALDAQLVRERELLARTVKPGMGEAVDMDADDHIIESKFRRDTKAAGAYEGTSRVCETAQYLHNKRMVSKQQQQQAEAPQEAGKSWAQVQRRMEIRAAFDDYFNSGALERRVDAARQVLNAKFGYLTGRLVDRKTALKHCAKELALFTATNDLLNGTVERAEIKEQRIASRIHYYYNVVRKKHPRVHKEHRAFSTIPEAKPPKPAPKAIPKHVASPRTSKSTHHAVETKAVPVSINTTAGTQSVGGAKYCETKAGVLLPVFEPKELTTAMWA